jgi:DNA-binding GntR family transcriptional regulator
MLRWMSHVNLSPRTKSDLAYRRLRELIAAGGFDGGERLTESKLAVQLGMKRGPIRESLLRLQAEGLLKSRGSRRSRVIMYTEDQDPRDMLHRYEVREQIEAGAAGLAAKNMNGWQIDALRELAMQVGQYADPSQTGQLYAAGMEFHQYLVANCGNPVLLAVWERERLAPPQPRSWEMEQKLREQMPPEHERASLLDVVDAIAVHDQDRAERLMKQRIRFVTNALRKVLSQGMLAAR